MSIPTSLFCKVNSDKHPIDVKWKCFYNEDESMIALHHLAFY